MVETAVTEFLFVLEKHRRQPQVSLAIGKGVAKAARSAQGRRAGRYDVGLGVVVRRDLQQFGRLGEAMDLVQNQAASLVRCAGTAQGRSVPSACLGARSRSTRRSGGTGTGTSCRRAAPLSAIQPTSPSRAARRLKSNGCDVPCGRAKLHMIADVCKRALSIRRQLACSGQVGRGELAQGLVDYYRHRVGQVEGAEAVAHRNAGRGRSVAGAQLGEAGRRSRCRTAGRRRGGR